MKRAVGGMLAVLTLASCRDPGDALYAPEGNLPPEIAPGLVRLTTGRGAELVRRFDSAGRLVVVVREPGDSGSVVLGSMDPAGGPIRAEAGAYGSVLPGLEPADYVVAGARRYLYALTLPTGGVHHCGDVFVEAPTLDYVGWRLYALPATDGAALSGLGQVSRGFPLITGQGFDSTGRPITPKRIRNVPATAEAGSLRTPAFGPAIAADGTAFLSDGETIWRVSPDDATVADSVTQGAYPALAPDGTLFFSRAVIADSTEAVTVVPYGFFACTETMVNYLVSDWMTFRRDPVTGNEAYVGAGAEPFPTSATVTVRRADGIYSINLSDTTAVRLVADSTATTPRLSPDGSRLAFTSRRSGTPDIFVLRLQ